MKKAVLTLVLGITFSAISLSSLSAQGGCCPGSKDKKKEKTEEKTKS